MKTQLLILSALLGVTEAVMATPLTPDEALSRLNDRKETASLFAVGSPKLAHTVLLPGSADPAVYLFSDNGKGRLLFVGADSRSQALLGYTDLDVDQFEYRELPPQLKWWLSEYAAQIAAAPESLLPSYLTFDKERTSAYAPSERKAIEPLLKTKWNQTAPFNSKCPGNAVVGCMGVALAQTVKYFEYPSKGTGTVYATAPDGRQVSLDLNFEFDWGNMLDEYVNGAYTTAQSDAVANLCNAMAFAFSTYFGTSMSSASLSTWLPSVYSYLGYEQSAINASRIDFTEDVWADMVYTNLAEVGPVPYFGGGVQGHHAFVCDGYSDEGLFHFNWGWGGYCDGYYSLSALNPAGYGTGGFASGYNLQQSAIFGMRPPRENPGNPDRRLMMEASSVSGYVMGYNVGIRCISGGWYNVCGVQNDFEIALEFENSATGTKLYSGSNVDRVSDNSGFGNWASSRLPDDLSDGTWLVRLVTRAADGSGWNPAYHPINVPDYFILTIENGSMKASDVSARTLTVDAVDLKTLVAVDKISTLSFTAVNNTDEYVEQRIAPAVCTSQGQIIASGDNIFVALRPGETKDVEFSFYTYATGNNDIVNGVNYRFVVYDADTRMILKDVKEIGFAPTKYGDGLLECDLFTLRGDNEKADPKDLVFDVEVKATRWYVGNQLLIAIFKDGVNILRHTHDEPITLSSGKSASYEVHVALPESETGKFAARPFYFESNQNRYYPLIEDRIYFSTDGSGVDGVEVEDSAVAFFDTGTGLIVADAPQGIASLEVYSVDGRLLASHAANGERTVNLPAESLAGSLLIVRVLDVNGHLSITRLLAH